MTFPRPSESPGLYVHLPFCRRRCRYCNFNACVSAPLVEPYLKALAREADMVAARYAGPPPDTVYLGGGTPSFLDPGEVASLLDRIRRAFQPIPGTEITLEANPADVDEVRAGRWVEAGVNRFTLGIQSAHASTLERMGRLQDAGRATEAVSSLRAAGVKNLVLDLILGLPGEGPGEWAESLDFVLSLAPEHVSLYILEVDPQTVLGHRVAEGDWVLPPEDEVADFYLEAIRRLDRAGLGQYEISNFARRGFSSRHNQKYWDLTPCLALGNGAHGFDGTRRFWNLSRIHDYLARMEERTPPPADLPSGPWGAAVEGVDGGELSERAREWAMLGLRRTAGIRLKEYGMRFGGSFPSSWLAGLKKGVEQGLVIHHNDMLRLTPLGMLLSNEVLQALWEEDPLPHREECREGRIGAVPPE